MNKAIVYTAACNVVDEAGKIRDDFGNAVLGYGGQTFNLSSNPGAPDIDVVEMNLSGGSKVNVNLSNPQATEAYAGSILLGTDADSPTPAGVAVARTLDGLNKVLTAVSWLKPAVRLLQGIHKIVKEFDDSKKALADARELLVLVEIRMAMLMHYAAEKGADDPALEIVRDRYMDLFEEVKTTLVNIIGNPSWCWRFWWCACRPCPSKTTLVDIIGNLSWCRRFWSCACRRCPSSWAYCSCCWPLGCCPSGPHSEEHGFRRSCWRCGASDSAVLKKLKKKLKDGQLENVEGTVMSVKHDTREILVAVKSVNEALKIVDKKLDMVLENQKEILDLLRQLHGTSHGADGLPKLYLGKVHLLRLSDIL